ncbi:MAG: hypothetical protein DI536_20610 [Archangium gephyra]|uniref:Uncharacterized protein n=1 Tax=Archangium gephyra TaxID=48 RepID=A0A2W5UMB4_9BACT|nr:MAG: hypothetical protein DI536_20610 [Archangium gephyra]
MLLGRVQVALQAPQFDGSMVTSDSQPSGSMLLQFDQPVSQVTTRQLPLAQFDDAWGRLQTLPHAPQFIESPIRSKPLSLVPSQSSSLPLHSSATGSPGVHMAVPPSTHELTERTHSPTPQVSFIWPSSVCPSQSSSRPLHVSATGSVALQTTWLSMRSHSFTPKQVPSVFDTSHCCMKSPRARQAHEATIGTHC